MRKYQIHLSWFEKEMFMSFSYKDFHLHPQIDLFEYF